MTWFRSPTGNNKCPLCNNSGINNAGEHIKVVGRWTHLNGAGGTCICECSDTAHLHSWMLNWSPICEISVIPVVDDATARKSLQGKPFFRLLVSFHKILYQ